MLRQTEILKAVVAIIKSKYPYKVYPEEVKENFSQPCFFIKFVKRTDSQTKNFNSNSLTLIITYFTLTQKGREVEFMEVADDVAVLFGTGFYAGKRYLPVDSISSEKIGEKRDILQIAIDLPYLDTTGYDPDAGYDKMQAVNIKYKINNEQEGKRV